MVYVVNERDSVLTNFEVAALLTAQQQQRDEEEAALPLPGARRGELAGTAAWTSQQSAAVVAEQVMGYLEVQGSTTQTQENIMAFMEAVKPFELTRMETQACINTPPSSIVEVHLLVEECEERLDQGRVRELLVLCHRTLVPPVSAEPEAADASGGAAAGEDGEGDPQEGGGEEEAEQA